MSNISLKVTGEKKWLLKTSIFLLVIYWGAQTHTDFIESLNFLLQLKNKNKTSRSKTVCGFSFILTLVEQKYKVQWKRYGIENGKSNKQI